MTNFERPPKQEIVDTRDRFMDYIGNALNGVLGELSMHEDEEMGERGQQVEEMLQKFFDRLELFLHEDFEEVGNITHENLAELLDRREEFLSEPARAHELYDVYQDLIRKEAA